MPLGHGGVCRGGGEAEATQAGQDKGQFSLHEVILAQVVLQTFHARIIFLVPGFRSEFFPGLRE